MQNRVREERLRRKWSQTELGWRTRTAQSTLSLIENGKTTVYAGWKRRIARAFGCAVDDVFPPEEKK